jgi:hypothetical protein
LIREKTSPDEIPYRQPLLSQPAPRSSNVRVQWCASGQSVVVTLTAVDLASPLAQYAQRFHAEIGDGHHVAAPLGAWPLLVLFSHHSHKAGTR